MSTLILLDAGPLGLVTGSKSSVATLSCNSWLDSLLLNGVAVRVPEIADYEVRRELLRANKFMGIYRLNRLHESIGYIPLTTETMLEAAQLWAQVRKQGLPTADKNALDADVILAAQAKMVGREGYKVVVATTNVKHLSRLVVAKEWRDILY